MIKEKYITVLVILSLIIFTSCRKNETPVEEPKFTGLAFNAITADDFRLSVAVDGELLTNHLFSPGGNIVYSNLKYFDPEHRMSVKDFYTGVQLIDTPISYKPGLINTVFFFQYSTGDPLVYVGPPVNEPLPGAGYTKISVVYTFAQLPDSVKVVVQNTAPAGPVNYMDTDSFTLRKGAFSKHFNGLNAIDRKPRLKFYSTQADRTLLGAIDAISFDDSNPDFSTYLFHQGTGPLNGVYTLYGQRLY